MKYLFFLSFISINVFSQNIIKSFYISNIISSEIFEEADTLGIKEDRLFVEFVLNTECKVENFAIKKSGKIKSFNQAVLKNSDKIIQQFLKEIECPLKESIFYLFPIIIKFEN